MELLLYCIPITIVAQPLYNPHAVKTPVMCVPLVCALDLFDVKLNPL